MDEPLVNGNGEFQIKDLKIGIPLIHFSWRRKTFSEGLVVPYVVMFKVEYSLVEGNLIYILRISYYILLSSVYILTIY